jgi:Rrf2 family protein
MAGQKRPAPTASHVIAQKRGIPERFLLKVLKPLVSAQVLLSVKGPNGGYRLARPASEITILEVLEAVDGPIRGHAPVGRDDPRNPVNRKLEQICQDSADAMRKQLGKIKLSDLSG